MSKVSVNILTKNRKGLLVKAIDSVLRQSYADFEIVIVNDGSTDGTKEVLENYKLQSAGLRISLKLIDNQSSAGIILSRQEALMASTGEYVAILDDDDEWLDSDKLKKQVEFLDKNPEYILAGGGIKAWNIKHGIWNIKFRPETDRGIRKWMLLKNPFFTSTVVFRKEAAIKVGGFIRDGIDLAEDYDLWLRLGKLGKMHNFPEIFVNYSKPSYNKDKLLKFFQKQLMLIKREKRNYHFYALAALVLNIRKFFYALFF